MGNLACVVVSHASGQCYTFCLLIVRYIISDKIKSKGALKAQTFLHVRDKGYVCYWYRLSFASIDGKSPVLFEMSA